MIYAMKSQQPVVNSLCLCCSTEVGRWSELCWNRSEGRFSTRTTVSSTIEELCGIPQTCGWDW